MEQEYSIDRLSIENASAVAQVYSNSYRQLSAQYKTQEEMERYTPAYFEQRVKNFLADQKSNVFVISYNGQPAGFVRYSDVPDAYRQPGVPFVTQPETGELRGVFYHYDREIEFSKPTPISSKTMILNQIYLDPNAAGHGLGTILLAETLPQMQQRYQNILVEYNANNTNAQKFYTSIGFKQIATTFDLDDIIRGRRYYSPVGIAHAKIADCVEILQARCIRKHNIRMNRTRSEGRTLC